MILRGESSYIVVCRMAGGRVTELIIPKSELPSGETLTIAAPRSLPSALAASP